MRSINIVLYILLGVFLGCEAGGGGNTSVSNDTNEPPPGFCGDGVCGTFEGDTPENCLNCASDCPCADNLVCNDVGECVQDPLADYYWIEGTWKCVSKDDGNCSTVDTVEIEITDWDENKGAQVEGFVPCSNGWAIKDSDGSQYLFTGQSETGETQCTEGKIDPLNKKNSFSSTGFGVTYVFMYIKL
ncbi:hypothetical protein HZB94_01065 [Candidatus Falkowbacteria bacterium]|nr:hypothetical protein [Candidatus Falkowbacteria bacterium]